MNRKAKIERKTKETSIVLELDLDGEGNSSIDTSIPFLN
ncbi:MAG: imidazoleglycerol-phosphate dehydratase, partial [Actinobacteria bacterium]|nr:imidazoleglycerol-phosphate dehydratase [Actinomycetota bacterium]